MGTDISYRVPTKTCILLLLLVVALVAVPVHAQDDYAAVLLVTHDGVELQRANAQNWLPLPAGAQAPIGAGDVLRTDTLGRASVDFLGAAQILILPETTFTLQDFHIATNRVTLRSRSQGLVIQQTSEQADFAAYELRAGGLTVTSPAALFAVQSDSRDVPALTVAAGQAQASVGGETVTVGAGYGLRLQAPFTPIMLTAPLNFARLDAARNGCSGTVETTGGVELRIRVGPGVGYIRRGAFNANADVQIMAVNESGTWYRIQYLNGYGWVLGLAVQSTCADVPRLPDDYQESLLQIEDGLDFELDILMPFFGRVLDDAWFYGQVHE